MRNVRPRFGLGWLRTAWKGVVLESLVCAFLLGPGCATQRQVREVVGESNAAVLAAQLADVEGIQFETGGPRTVGSGTTSDAWKQASGKIDAFVAAHADQKTTVAVLRLRQGIMLLSHGQDNLARAAFNAVNETDLPTDRDKALKRLQEHLLWWFTNSNDATWDAEDNARAAAALAAIKAEQVRVSSSPEIRDYLAEMRAWIGLRAAKAVTGGTGDKELFEDALETYALIFTAEDLDALKAGNTDRVSGTTVPQDLRRRLRAKAVLAYAQKVMRAQQLQLELRRAPAFLAILNRDPIF